LGDFGESLNFEMSGDNFNGSDSHFHFNQINGSMLWMAPEIFLELPRGTRSDIWSLGCTLIELLTAHNPWPDVREVGQIFEKIQAEEKPRIPPNISPEAK